ncbi:hypothetical protein NSQ77_16020 [Oceanobacillus sp. FSL K6-2867]|uniref:hypothetical protein n=1 Tax=Oceanobacillus sp. FSL K6-2867 TaxID=2954748 RepID=UPI0030D7514E
MRINWKVLFFSSLFSLSLLAACNVNNNDSNEQQGDVNNSPADYENDANLEGEENQENKSIYDEDPDQTDQELQKGDDLEFDSDRGAE